GVMKPVQCSGDDAEFLTNALDLQDNFEDINPYYADEPLSPHLAFKRRGEKISVAKILKSHARLKANHDVVLVEGAGGWRVPLNNKYDMADLACDLEAQVIVVTRLGLGTINHTLLTLQAIRQKGLSILGVVFCQSKKDKLGLSEVENPEIIRQLGDVKILGVVPYLSKISTDSVLRESSVDFKKSIQMYLPREMNLSNRLSTARSKALSVADQKYVWHPFTQMKDWEAELPLVIDRAKGCYLIDTQGNKYLDGVSSLWVTVHGHSHKAITQALQEQVVKLDHSTMLGLSNTPAIALAKKLVEITPKGLDKVFYSDNGSTSVEIAIKMAYQYWQNVGKTKKTKIVHLENSYHGDTLGSVSIGGIDLFHQVYKHMIFKTIKLDMPDGYRDEDFNKALNNFEALLLKNADSIAALVVEPLVQGAAGMFVWPKGVLKKLRELTKKYDVFLICDEVATGFGRTGKMFACEHENVNPDFLCLSKGITGGCLALAATLTTKQVYEGFKFPYADMKTFFHGHTYTGNPIACAAAIANIELFKKERTLAQLGPKIKFLEKKLKMFYALRSVGSIRQMGFMVGIELVKDKGSKEAFDWRKKIGVLVCNKARERGVIIRPLGNVIVLMPPLSIKKSELEELTNVVCWAIGEVVG
ncbi:MAG: adenosylmethionine-8-amino-7-oxononanoate aminotransferase, partial [Candidatus Omnitrophota bacterium]